MIQYDIYCEQAHQRYIQFKAVFSLKAQVASIQLELPSWRPGRYEIANFAKNIKAFKAFGNNNAALKFEKTNKDTWEIFCQGHDQITIHYSYYAAELNAGSSFLDPKQLYINPINCFLYDANNVDQPYSIHLHIPSNWQIASALHFDSKRNCVVADFDTLVDSPFICSPEIDRRSYQVNGIEFHICFNEQKFIPWDRVLDDFKKFTQRQLQDFGEFPNDEFTFLIQSLPHIAYHGVEHLKSTVVVIGPSNQMFNERYCELLGVCSHELFHVWNIKALRPTEMKPYNFKKENYSFSGFIYEGVTTYMGDIYLLRSGVFTLDQYLVEFSKQIQKHLENPARFSMSVADASFDTWLDGYVVGAPGRKVSIYTEGCLLAFYTDYRMRKATNNKYGLEHVIKTLYFNFSNSNKGYTIHDYQAVLENMSGESFETFFNDYVFSTKAYEALLIEAFDYFGLELSQKPANSYIEARLGAKVTGEGKEWRVMSIFPGSPADTGGLALGDLILGVNNYRAFPSIEHSLSFFESQPKTLLVERNGRFLELLIPEVDRVFYVANRVLPVSNISTKQQKDQNLWCS